MDIRRRISSKVAEIETDLRRSYQEAARYTARQIIKGAVLEKYTTPEGAVEYILKSCAFRRNDAPVAFWAFVDDVTRELRKEGYDIDRPHTWRPHEANVNEVMAVSLPTGGKTKAMKAIEGHR